MTHKKRRVSQHIMEDDSYDVIRKHLPAEWVIRKFNSPDYGIDLVIELFEKVEGEDYAETLGEFIYVQVKSTRNILEKNEKFFPVKNVTKFKWLESRSEYVEASVVKYPFDTNSIYTIETWGASVSVLLLVVNLATEDVYFVCLNDYIDKILIPRMPDYGSQESITVTIPALNNLKDKVLTAAAFSLYGKRAKLLAAFSKFTYQRNEIGYLFGIRRQPMPSTQLNVEVNHPWHTSSPSEREAVISTLLLFIEQIEHLDIWQYPYWGALHLCKSELEQLKQLLSNPMPLRESIIPSATMNAWNHLANLANMYEEICREWYLPKMLGLLSSYPIMPDIIESQS